jgi:hypothetical protein
MSINSQTRELQTYVNMTLFHQVKFYQIGHVIDLFVMPMVVKHFNLLEEEERPGGTWFQKTK